jgi:hypothetical protein
MGLSLFGVQSCSAARGKFACHFGDKFAGDGKLTGKRVSHPPLWECKCQLMKLKAKVDQALISVCEGPELYGPGCKPKVPGRKKRRKCWAQKNPKPNSRPEAQRVSRFCIAACASGGGFGFDDGVWRCWVASGKVRGCRWFGFCLATLVFQSFCSGEPLYRYCFQGQNLPMSY